MIDSCGFKCFGVFKSVRGGDKICQHFWESQKILANLVRTVPNLRLSPKMQMRNCLRRLWLNWCPCRIKVLLLSTDFVRYRKKIEDFWFYVYLWSATRWHTYINLASTRCSVSWGPAWKISRAFFLRGAPTNWTPGRDELANLVWLCPVWGQIPALCVFVPLHSLEQAAQELSYHYCLISLSKKQKLVILRDQFLTVCVVSEIERGGGFPGGPRGTSEFLARLKTSYAFA